MASRSDLSKSSTSDLPACPAIPENPAFFNNARNFCPSRRLPSSSPSTHRASTLIPAFSSASAPWPNSASSTRQGAHQVAHRLMSTGELLVRLPSATLLPSKSVNSIDDGSLRGWESLMRRISEAAGNCGSPEGNATGITTLSGFKATPLPCLRIKLPPGDIPRNRSVTPAGQRTLTDWILPSLPSPKNSLFPDWLRNPSPAITVRCIFRSPMATSTLAPMASRGHFLEGSPCRRREIQRLSADKSLRKSLRRGAVRLVMQMSGSPSPSKSVIAMPRLSSGWSRPSA
jgi:hypothetical protein